MQQIILGTDDVSVTIKIVDSTDFSPETGVTSASAGLALWYRKGALGAVTAITESDLAGVDSAHSDGGMKHVSDGVYRLDLPDAAIPTIENEITTVGGTVTGMQVLGTALVGVQAIGAPAGASVSADVLTVRDVVEYQRGGHTATGIVRYVDGLGGNDVTGTGSRSLPYATITKALADCSNNRHDLIILLPSTSGNPNIITEAAGCTVNKRYTFIRGVGRDVRVTRAGAGDVFTITANGVELAGMQIATAGASSNAVTVSGADFARLYRLWIDTPTQDGIRINVGTNCRIENCTVLAAGRDGVRVDSGAGSGYYAQVIDNVIRDCTGSAVNLIGTDANDCRIQRNVIRDNAVGLTVAAGVTDTVFTDNRLVNNTSVVVDGGTRTLNAWNVLTTDASGQVTVGAVANDAITAAAIAASAITSSEAPALANLDAAVSTRSTYAGADTAGTTTLLSRLSAARAGYLDNLSAGAVATAASIASLPAAVWDRLTSALTTAGSIGKWLLDNAGTGASPATFWAYATRTITQSAAQVAAAVAGPDLTVLRGDTFSATLTGLVIPANWTRLIFTAKRSLSDADTASIVQIILTNPGAGTDGLKYLEGAAPVAPVVAADGSLTVPGLTSVVIAMKPEATKLLTVGAGSQYDIQADYGAASDCTTVAVGMFAVSGDVTRTVPV